MKLVTGAFLSLGSVSDIPDWSSIGLRNVPSLLGECIWTLQSDTMFPPWLGVTHLVRLP